MILATDPAPMFDSHALLPQFSADVHGFLATVMPMFGLVFCVVIGLAVLKALVFPGDGINREGWTAYDHALESEVRSIGDDLDGEDIDSINSDDED
jgi:hypothetical protein